MLIDRTLTGADYAAWHATGHIYALYGALVVDGERRIIERLPDVGLDDPRYEVHAPAGRVYSGGEHSRLCRTLADCRDWGGERTELDTETE